MATSPTAALAAAHEKEKNFDYVHREALFTQVRNDPTAAGGHSAPGASSGKLPFNYRKLRWFDCVTASDRATARKFLRDEFANAQKRDRLDLIKHLRKMQRREKWKMRNDKGGFSDDDSGWNSDDDDNDDAPLEPAALTAAGISRFPQNMTPALSAALVLESLSITPLESVEGMSKCYDGIVAAGTALLDWELENSDTTTSVSRQEEKSKTPSKSDIIAALAPLLITTLEHPSGETILELARLRKMCGSRRYQRRFVQRIAPCLVRPPNAALWCLKHQNDMLAILAATEMILDAAFEIFAAGWYDRGQTLLADSHRAETLRAAANALKELSNDSSMMGFMTPGGGHGHRRANSYILGKTPSKDSTSKNAPLAEWEVLAVDRQIRKSISNILTMDWGRVVLSSAPPRDGDDASSQGRVTRNRRGITSSKSKNISTTAPEQQSNQLELLPTLDGGPVPPGGSPSPSSPRKIPLSPRAKNPAVSPHSPNTSLVQSAAAPSVEALESAFGPSFVTQTVVAVGPSDSSSPDSSPPPAPLSPPRGASGPRLPAIEDIGEVIGSRNRTVIGSSSVTPPQTPRPQHLNLVTTGAIVPGTPPRSPSSPPRGMMGSQSSTSTSLVVASPVRGSSTPPFSSTGTLPLASHQGVGSENFGLNAPQIPVMSPPHRGLGRPEIELPTTPSRAGGIAPLSPSSVGVDSIVSGVSQRSGSTQSGTSGLAVQSLQNAHYRMLTSTAAERKRTVAACRALRAQITRFEEAFIQLHGRPPKGAAERAPLATTYAQYREWKRAIRADAACRIQALFRGARMRWSLLRSSDPSIAAFIDKYDLKRLAIPWEIGGSGPEQPNLNHVGSRGPRYSPPTQSPSGAIIGCQLPSPHMVPYGGGDEGSEISNVGVEVVISPGSSSNNSGAALNPPTLSPNWSTNQPPLNAAGPGWRNRSNINNEDISHNGPQHVGMPPSESSPSGRASVTLQELQARKRELKQELKQYDMNFHRQHNRMPAKAEKEPIRHLYEKYNLLKSQISMLEKENAGQGTAAPSNYHRPSHPRQHRVDVPSPGDVTGSPPNTSSRLSPQGYGEPRTGASGTSTPTGLPTQDLAALKAEKGQLHQMLRSYEKDFYREHKRQVSSFADIRPVASQYRRYKDIKKQIASLQGQDKKG